MVSLHTQEREDSAIAVHDVDTSSDGRVSPMPMLHDVSSTRKADGTQGVTQKIDTDTGAYVSTKDAQIVVNNGTNDVITIGRQSQDQSFGMLTNDGTNNRMLIDTNGQIKISQPGYDVRTAVDSQLIFNSDNNLFKVVLSGTTSLVYDGSVNTYKTIPHGQSTIPIVLAYVQLPSTATNFSPMQSQYVPMPFYQLRTGLPAVQCVQSVDSTNIYLRVHDIYSSPSTPETYNFRYYVLQETSN